MATHVAKPLSPYIPRKPVKNWIGLARIPDSASAENAIARLRKFKGVVSIEEPLPTSKTMEDYHVTVVWGFDEKRIDQAAEKLAAFGLVEDDLKFKIDPATGLAVVELFASQKGDAAFAILQCVESPAFKAARQAMIDEFLPKGAWTPKLAHVTVGYGKFDTGSATATAAAQ